VNVNPISLRRVSASERVFCELTANGAGPRPRTHGHATLVYHTAGHATFEQNGRWRVEPGDILVIPAGQPHLRLSTHGSEYWGLGICMPCFDDRAGVALPDPFERVRKGAHAVVSISSSRRAFTNELFQELANDSSPHRGSSAAVQRSLLTLILHEVVNALGDKSHPVVHEGGVAADALRFIESHYMQPLTLGQVARAVGRSSAYVTTALSQATGKSAVAWITTYRLAQARTLLVHTNERIETVAERVGYRDTTHFIRMFRRAAGVTPAAYRASHRTPTTE
jgi:AraC family transcriptional regulator, transcriptional activator of pobA